jgi:hypothetical protein
MSVRDAPEPVFVIHGVANRGEGEFNEAVSSLQVRVNAVEGAERYKFHPVYWGNLQPGFDGLKDTIPGATEPSEALGGDDVGTGSGLGVSLPGRIGGWIDKAATLGPLENLAEAATSKLRVATLPGASDGLGDLFVYVDRRHDIQQRLRDRLTDVLGQDWQSQPVSILGHSLGGITAFDAACSTAPLVTVKHLVTFGSQSAVLHVLDPRQDIVLRPKPEVGLESLDPYVPGTPTRPSQPTRLPVTIGSWLSIWHAMDPLAFLAGKVFKLHDDSPVFDRRIEGQERTWSQAHSSYWWHSEMPGLIAAALAGRPLPSV